MMPELQIFRDPELREGWTHCLGSATAAVPSAGINSGPVLHRRSGYTITSLPLAFMSRNIKTFSHLFYILFYILTCPFARSWRISPFFTLFCTLSFDFLPLMQHASPKGPNSQKIPILVTPPGCFCGHLGPSTTAPTGIFQSKSALMSAQIPWALHTA